MLISKKRCSHIYTYVNECAYIYVYIYYEYAYIYVYIYIYMRGIGQDFGKKFTMPRLCLLPA